MSGTAAAAPVAPPPTESFASWLIPLYFLASLTFGLTQGLSTNLVAANIQAAQSQFGATTNEALWLSAAYTATNVTATLLLFKFRAQYGVRLFAKLGLTLFFVVSLAPLFTNDLNSAVVLRAVAGFATAPLGTLAFLYMLEPLAQQYKLTSGLAWGLIGGQLAVPLARLISPDLLQLGLWHGLNMMELGMAMISLAIVFLLPITPPPRSQAFDLVDLISFPLLAAGCGMICVVLTLGRYYWWTEAPWLGVTLAGGIACLALVVAIELNREKPMLHLHWISSIDILSFGGSMLMVRFVLAEQTSVIAFFQNLGLLNEHMRGMFWVIFCATVVGYAGVSFFNRPALSARIHVLALALIAVGAWMDSHATSLTRPQDLYLSQGMIAFGAAIFLPSAMAWSFTHVFRTGMQYLASYLAVFLVTQNFGALLGSASLGTLLIYREKFHSSQIVESLVMQNPIVAQRVQQYAGAYTPTLGDPTLRAAEGTVMLGQVATREAYVLAYNDVFLAVAVSAGFALVMLLGHSLFKRLRSRDTQAA
jgi:MFS family permease